MQDRTKGSRSPSISELQQRIRGNQPTVRHSICSSRAKMLPEHLVAEIDSDLKVNEPDRTVNESDIVLNSSIVRHDSGINPFAPVNTDSKSD